MAQHNINWSIETVDSAASGTTWIMRGQGTISDFTVQWSRLLHSKSIRHYRATTNNRSRLLIVGSNAETATKGVAVFRFQALDSSLFTGVTARDDGNNTQTENNNNFFIEGATPKLSAYSRAAGAASSLGTAVNTSFVARDIVVMRWEDDASGNVKIKVWKISDSEPGSWTFTSTSTGLTSAGYVGLIAFRAGHLNEWFHLAACDYASTLTEDIVQVSGTAHKANGTTPADLVVISRVDDSAIQRVVPDGSGNFLFNVLKSKEYIVSAFDDTNNLTKSQVVVAPNTTLALKATDGGALTTATIGGTISGLANGTYHTLIFDTADSDTVGSIVWSGDITVTSEASSSQVASAVPNGNLAYCVITSQSATQADEGRNTFAGPLVLNHV